MATNPRGVSEFLTARAPTTLVVGAVWAASFVALSLMMASFRCPRCGNLYHIRWGVGGNPWVKRCMHCGLELRGGAND